MQSYVVIFESPNKANAMIRIIKASGGWGKITANSWVSVTSKTATQLRDELIAVKDAGDRIFVVRSGAVAAWSNVHASTEWIKKYI